MTWHYSKISFLMKNWQFFSIRSTKLIKAQWIGKQEKLQYFWWRKSKSYLRVFITSTENTVWTTVGRCSEVDLSKEEFRTSFLSRRQIWLLMKVLPLYRILCWIFVPNNHGLRNVLLFRIIIISCREQNR